MNLTHHASCRARQRGVPRSIVQAIYTYGTCRRSRGLVALTLDRRALDLANDDCGERLRRDLGRYAGVYAIVGDEGQVVTIARRRRRVRK